MLLLGLAGKAVWECSKELLKDTGAGLIEKVGHALHARTREGTLPPNHDLDHALWRSLGKAARVLAHTIHKPERAPLSKLITDLNTDLKVAPLAKRLMEMVRGNIAPEQPSEHWLFALIAESKKPDAFKDFSLGCGGQSNAQPASP
jgi:hypothetical protein